MGSVEEMQQELSSMKEFLIRQSREILKLKRAAAGGQPLEEEEDDYLEQESGQARLNFVEHQESMRARDNDHYSTGHKGSGAKL